MMELKAIVPDMEKTFGVLEFAGEGKTTTTRVGGVTKTVSRQYHLFSSVQRADDIEVRLPGEAGEKKFDYEEPIELVNARIIAEGYSIGERGYSDYILLADDIVIAGQKEGNAK